MTICNYYRKIIQSPHYLLMQMAVEMMLRDVDVAAAWTGLYKTNTWQFFDGTLYNPETSFRRWKPGNDETSSRLFVRELRVTVVCLVLPGADFHGYSYLSVLFYYLFQGKSHVGKTCKWKYLHDYTCTRACAHGDICCNCLLMY